MEGLKSSHLFVVRLGGHELEVNISLSSTVADLKRAIESSAETSTGAISFAYRLMSSTGTFLDDGSKQLQDLGVEDGDSITLIKLLSRDYAKISDFEKTVKCEAYPNGVLIDSKGTTYVCHYYGKLSVYDADLNLVKVHSLPGQSPSQMAFSDTGELLIAFAATPRRIGVFQIDDDFKLLRWIGDDDRGWGNPRGLAFFRGRVFVSRQTSICVYDFHDASLIEQISGSDFGGFKETSGLSIFDDRLLVIADRRSNRIILLDLETLKLVSSISATADEHGHLKYPNDSIVDSAGNILVMDTGNERIAVFREDGSFVATVMKGFFVDHGNTYSYMAYNSATGAIAVSNNDEHKISVLKPIFTD